MIRAFIIKERDKEREKERENSADFCLFHKSLNSY